MPKPRPDPRRALLDKLLELAEVAVMGSLSETYRTCGKPACRCHGPGPKHGPHLYVSYRGGTGKTTGYYVPKAAQADIRRGIEAWQQIKELLAELSDLNRQRVLETARAEDKS